MKALLVLLLALLFGALPAAAHLTPNSEIRLDFGADRVEAEAIIPLAELSFALRRQVPDRLGPVRDAALRSYLVERMAVPGWQVRLTGLDVVHEAGPADLRARFLLLPPPGASPRAFDLHYRAVIDRVPNHIVLVVARNDFAGGHLSERPQMLGGLQSGAMSLRVDRGAGSDWRGFASAIRLGMHHIAEGHDHLLFLIALLLPAPVLAAGRRWNGYGGLRHTLRGLVAVVTAFTIGHSLTLIGGAFFGWQLPAQPVEIGIALSILISAIHAWRPLFAGREAWIAAGFGLVHGLAFATLIGRFGLDPLQKAKSILGFNIGIELVQLMVVAAVMPALVLLARTRFHPGVRSVGAGFAAVAALAWIVERSMATENPVGRIIDMGLGHAGWLWCALVSGALAAAALDRHSQGQKPTKAMI
ncbi:HupE/UreJ family protein [Sphingomonas sp. ID1715]|uniref:HupE/UreJ family protein n=1 Tax=Sphingomonas sp. ID1715 TaxID=1656898 RepID=UPI001487C0C4|nr:HupE/UreJ family protein [Sphingomonas sp. ID1715]NNM76607.1 HupE/UreJ family protein [Sphingomonas sp. ID1715]